MEPQKRTHLVNELMQEANLMMGVLEKAMQGERFEETHPALHGTGTAAQPARVEAASDAKTRGPAAPGPVGQHRAG